MQENLLFPLVCTPAVVGVLLALYHQHHLLQSWERGRGGEGRGWGREEKEGGEGKEEIRGGEEGRGRMGKRGEGRREVEGRRGRGEEQERR